MNAPRRIHSEPSISVDETIRQLAVGLGADELHPSCLIPAATLRKAEYAAAFPQLLTGVSVARDPDRDPDRLFERENLSATEFFLSPAACYHAYAHLESSTLTDGARLTMKATCFRNEERALSPGRRQLEFEMREIVFVGAPEWVEAEIRGLMPRFELLADSWHLAPRWGAASDPFFMPRAAGRAHMQRLLGAKQEWCLDDGLAIASINRHGSFFGERFAIKLASGEAAHTACAAFGIDRIEHHLPS